MGARKQKKSEAKKKEEEKEKTHGKNLKKSADDVIDIIHRDMSDAEEDHALPQQHQPIPVIDGLIECYQQDCGNSRIDDYTYL